MAVQNSIGGGSFIYPQLTGVKFLNAFGSNLSTGDNDLYTVPTGKKALVCSAGRAYNQSGGNIAYYSQIKVGGTYYRVGATTVTLATVTASSLSIQTSFMLNAGEILSVNTATNNGLNIWHIIYEMDASSPIYGGRVLGLANGDNTLFTISAGKTGTLLSGALSLFVLSSYSIINNSGGARSITTYLVPSGGTAGATNLITPATNVNDGANQAITIGASMNAGDFVVINTNSGAAGQNAFALYYEI